MSSSRGRCREIYESHECCLFNETYLTKKYWMPFASFVYVNIMANTTKMSSSIKWGYPHLLVVWPLVVQVTQCPSNVLINAKWKAFEMTTIRLFRYAIPLVHMAHNDEILENWVDIPNIKPLINFVHNVVYDPLTRDE